MTQMKVHVISEFKQEWTIPPATAEEAKDPANYKKGIKHHFSVCVIDPPDQGWGIRDNFNISADLLPPDTKIGDEFVVHFDRAEK